MGREFELGLRKQPLEDPDGKRRRGRAGMANPTKDGSRGRVTIGVVQQLSVGGPGDIAGVMGLLALQQPNDGGPNAGNTFKVAAGTGIQAVRFYLRNQANVVVAGPTDVEPVNGEAAWGFTNPGVVGDNYTVLAEDRDNPQVNLVSAPFDVAAGQSITFTAQPVNGLQSAQQTVTVGVSGLSQVRFTLFNAGNQPVGGPATVNVLGGNASWTFTNPTAANGFYVVADDPVDGSPTVASSSFSTSINQTLSITQQPQGGPQGSTGSMTVNVSGITTVVFRLRDLSNNLVSQGTVAVVGGVAQWTFPMPAPGTYTIAAADDADGTPNATSNQFTSTAAQALTFTQQPSNGTVGSNVTVTVTATSLTGVVFRLRDSLNNVLASSPTVTVAGGQASWTRARPAAGSGYFFSAEDAADGQPLVNSASFDSVLAEAITITAQPANGTVAGSGSITVSATALANVRFTMKQANNSNAAAPVTVAVSGGTATHNFTYPAASTGLYFLVDDPVDGQPFQNSAPFNSVAGGDPNDPTLSAAVEFEDEDGGDYFVSEDGTTFFEAE